jgi:hypothetical protein
MDSKAGYTSISEERKMTLSETNQNSEQELQSWQIFKMSTFFNTDISNRNGNRNSETETAEQERNPPDGLDDKSTVFKNLKYKTEKFKKL